MFAARPVTRTRFRIGFLVGPAAFAVLSACAPNDESSSSTSAFVDTIAVGEGPGSLIEADNSIWVVNRTDGMVSVIDTASRTVIDTIAVGERGWADLLEVDNSIWVTSLMGGPVSVFEP